MRVLIVWGSRMGGTEGIATLVGEELDRAGFEVTLSPAITAPSPREFAAVIVGGALYTDRWHPEAYRYVCRHRDELRRRPVWMFSSGPIESVAGQGDVPPAPQVATLMERIGALGHVTFVGRSTRDARGHTLSSHPPGDDGRDPARVRAWAGTLAAALPTAQPRPSIDPAGQRLPRLFAHAVAGWAAAALLGRMLTALGDAGTVLTMLLTPAIFAAVAYRYFRPGGTRAPLPTALGFTGAAALLDLSGASFAWLLAVSPDETPLALLLSPVTFWLPLVLIALATWATGTRVQSSSPSSPSSPSSSSSSSQPPAPPYGLTPGTPTTATSR